MARRSRFLIALTPLLFACGSSVSDDGTGSTTGSKMASTTTAQTGSATTTGTGSGGAGGSGGCGEDPPSMDQVLDATSDPDKATFTLDTALAGLPEGPGPLRAIIDTDQGTLTCELSPDKAPNGVANFVGLARGRRAWKDPVAKKWVRRRFYDGLIFHRVIPEFVAQGGDPLGTGTGGPGYSFADEISDLKHVAGALAYANSGPNTNGSQYYVTETAQPSLDGHYTVFGVCTPVSVVTLLTHVPVDANDKPVTPEKMETIKITRCAP